MSRYKSLEAFKFAVYISIPISLTAFLVYRPDNLQKIIASRAYVKYPAEGPRPPGLEEILESLKKEKE